MVNEASSPADRIAVLCPRCELPMMRGAAKPIMFTSGLSDVAFTCEACGAEARRTVTVDGTPHLADKQGKA